MFLTDKLLEEIKTMETSINEVTDKYGISTLKKEHSYDPNAHMTLLHQYEDTINAKDTTAEKKISRQMEPYNHLVFTYTEFGELPGTKETQDTLITTEHPTSILNNLYQLTEAIYQTVMANPKSSVITAFAVLAAPFFMGAMVPGAAAQTDNTVTPDMSDNTDVSYDTLLKNNHETFLNELYENYPELVNDTNQNNALLTELLMTRDNIDQLLIAYDGNFAYDSNFIYNFSENRKFIRDSNLRDKLKPIWYEQEKFYDLLVANILVGNLNASVLEYNSRYSRDNPVLEDESIYPENLP
ncbi:MAG: hypothetical protein KAS11_01530, partial [Candidatus Aenigmarchaeota archaeon]|nr:hypothetical protein [Candidatus Aenigmarchaeota archaeon]